jgi:hypothetical protein
MTKTPCQIDFFHVREKPRIEASRSDEDVPTYRERRTACPVDTNTVVVLAPILLLPKERASTRVRKSEPIKVAARRTREIEMIALVIREELRLTCTDARILERCDEGGHPTATDDRIVVQEN